MKPHNHYILWLPSWYPNKLQPYNGDFVQRHALAYALYGRVEIIHVVKDEDGSITHSIKIEKRQQGNLSETIIYYYFPHRHPQLLNRFRSHARYKRLLKAAIDDCVKEKGLPRLLHVYIALKAGVVGHWFKKKYGVNYVVGEQSTLYLAEARPNFWTLSFPFRRAARNIYRHASAVMVVSNYLADALVKLFQIRQPQVIPNVVDDTIFHFRKKPAVAPVSFIHISNLTYQKNAEGMLRAFKRVKERGYAFKLRLVGPVNDAVKALAAELKLNDEICFHHEMPQQQLVHLIQQSDALVLFSRYETFGCVVIEALACGRPVILSDIAVFHENANESNALFAQNENREDLAEKIIQFILQSDQYDREKISLQTVERYNFSIVGRQIAKWYEEVLGQ